MTVTASLQNCARVSALPGAKLPPPTPCMIPSASRTAAVCDTLLSEISVNTAEAGATMIKPARHRLTNLFFIFLPVLSFYCVRSASTGCRFEALLAGYSPKMMPSSAENRNAPMTSPAEGSTVNCSTVGM